MLTNQKQNQVFVLDKKMKSVYNFIIEKELELCCFHDDHMIIS